MFTRINTSKWNYMFLAAAATIAVAAVTALISMRSRDSERTRAEQENEQVIKNRYDAYNETTTLRFVN